MSAKNISRLFKRAGPVYARSWFACLLRPAEGPPKDRSTSSSNPMMERQCADSVEKHEPVSDTNTAFVDGRLTPAGRLEKQDITAADGPQGVSQGDS